MLCDGGCHAAHPLQQKNRNSYSIAIHMSTAAPVLVMQLSGLASGFVDGSESITARHQADCHT